MWPFTKRLDTPKSQATTNLNATDVITEGLIARARQSPPVASDVAAIAACRNVWSRCGHAMRVEGELAEQLQSQLAWVMSSLATHGNAYLRIMPSGRLMACGLASIQGGSMPSSWEYHLSELGPTKTRTIVVPGREVIHARIGTEPQAPWRGKSPLAKLTAEAAARLEEMIASARPEYAVSMDVPLDSDDIRQFQQQIRRLQSDRLPVLLGDAAKVTPLPALDNLAQVRSDVAATIAQSFGLGPGFFSQDAQGVASREAWRQFLNGTVEPIARMIEAEATAKTGVETRIDVTELRLVDLAQAAKSFAAFREAGLDEDEALRLAGISDD